MLPALLPPGALAAQLRALGLHAGDLVMAHASLRALGAVEGGAAGVIAGLRSVTDAGGTLLMMVAARDDVPFDALTTPADPDNGILAEVFRTCSGVAVNDHPACRFAALGPLASELLEPQPLHDYYGAGSPLERFVERGGRVLRLGADLDTVTLTHYAENVADLPNKRRVARRYVRADVGEVTVEGIDDTDGIADWAGGDYFPRILIDFLGEGRASTGPVGQCQAELLGGAEFVDFAVAWLERNLSNG